MILQDSKLHYMHLNPKALHLFYPNITFVFMGEDIVVRVKGIFESHNGFTHFDQFVELDMPEFMTFRHQMKLGAKKELFKVPELFLEVLITIREDSKIITDQLIAMEHEI